MKTKKELVTWADQKISEGVPRQIVCDMLLELFDSNLDTDEMEAVLDVQDRVFDVMLQRNLRGVKFEKNGQVDKAIIEYEANVADGFSGSHPYERLRVIYNKEKRISDIVRVCEKFLSVLEKLRDKGSTRPDLQPKIEKFKGYIRKYQS